MPTVQSSQVQVQAYRFGLRRLDAALLTGDPLPGPDPNRPTRSALLVGLVLVAVLVLVSVIWGLLRPEKSIGDAPLVLDRASGTVYVVRAGTLYPALNLASALLVIGAAANRSGAAGGSGQRPAVKVVDPKELRGFPRGPLLGIPGAPNAVPAKADLEPARWTACDDVSVAPGHPPGLPVPARTSVLVGVAAAANLRGSRAVLAAGADGALYLLVGGVRAEVSTDPRVLRALAVDPGSARPISSGLLAAIPESAPIRAPLILHAGTLPRYSVGGNRIGTVVRVELADSSKLYVLLADGIEEISPLMANLISFSLPDATAIVSVPAAEISAAPLSGTPLAQPSVSTTPTVLSEAADPVLCVAWQAGRWALFAGAHVPIPAGAAPVGMPAGGSGASAVYVPPGHGAVVAAVSGGESAAVATHYLVTDEGVRYPVSGDAVLRMFALGGAAVAIPGALVGMLPAGPTLDPSRASATWTSVPTPGPSSSR